MGRAEQSQTIIENYYDAFNNKDWDRFFSLVDEHVRHDIANGPREVGKAAFKAYMDHRNECYDEQIENIEMEISPEGDEAEVEFDILGTYVKTDGNLPPASGQKYRLSGGAFFTVKGGKVTRLSNFFDPRDWNAQVSKNQLK